MAAEPIRASLDRGLTASADRGRMRRRFNAISVRNKFIAGFAALRDGALQATVVLSRLAQAVPRLRPAQQVPVSTTLRR